jgi:hypothetical protein
VLWTAGPNDLWALTDDSGLVYLPAKLARWNGAAWTTPQDVDPTFTTPRGIWGTAGDAWVAGSAAFHIAGGQATRYLFPYAPAAVWGSGPNDVWMVGGSQTIDHWNGQTWSSTGGNNFIYFGVWGTAANDIWLAGEDGAIQHYDGQNWSPVPSGIFSRLYAIDGNASGDAWIIGETGVILQRSGGSWVSSPSGTGRNLLALTVTAGGEAWVVGSGGTILHHPPPAR